MKINELLLSGILIFLIEPALFCQVFIYDLPGKDIYHDNWIDLNKNGRKDIYEDPSRTVDERIEDLISQMTLAEKTCQMATLCRSTGSMRTSRR